MTTGPGCFIAHDISQIFLLCILDGKYPSVYVVSLFMQQHLDDDLQIIDDVGIRGYLCACAVV